MTVAAGDERTVTEIDLLETVVVPRTLNDVVHVFREPSVVDVLIPYRDTTIVASGDAFALLLWRFGTPRDALLMWTSHRSPATSARWPVPGAGRADRLEPRLDQGWLAAVPRWLNWTRGCRERSRSTSTSPLFQPATS